MPCNIIMLHNSSLLYGQFWWTSLNTHILLGYVKSNYIDQEGYCVVCNDWHINGQYKPRGTYQIVVHFFIIDKYSCRMITPRCFWIHENGHKRNYQLLMVSRHAIQYVSFLTINMSYSILSSFDQWTIYLFLVILDASHMLTHLL